MSIRNKSSSPHPGRNETAGSLPRRWVAAGSLKALYAQGLALIGTLAIGAVAATVSGGFPPSFMFVLGDGVLAAILGRVLGLPSWWLPINFCFAPLAYMLLGLAIAPHWYLVAFAAMFAIFGATYRTQVPLYLSSAAAIRALDQVLPRRPDLRFLDVGCGTGTVLAGVSRLRRHVRVEGVEAAWLPWLASWGRGRFGRRRFGAVRGNFWQCDFSGFDVVYAFLSPAPMVELWRKARGEMRSGTLFISNSFAVPGVAPSATIAVIGAAPLYVWRM